MIAMEDKTRRNTIGILYPGEMGTSFGKLLCEAGVLVVTTTEGRSSWTQRLCHDAGLSVLGSLGELIERSDILISLVSPRAALSVARSVAAHRGRPARPLLYVDANSISPTTVAQISEVLSAASIDFVDGSIFGLASQLQARGRLYLSGSRAEELATQFRPLLRVKTLGDLPGQASALKMIVSGIPKGLSGLFVELMHFAQEMHLHNEAIDACEDIYPTIMEIMRRMLPTYPLHAGRRCEELQEAEETMSMSGVTPRIVRAVREVTSDIAGAGWSDYTHNPQQWTIADIIERIYPEGALRGQQFQFTKPHSGDAVVKR